VEAVRERAHRLEIVSAERIRDELDRLIVVPHPAPGLWFLVDTGLAEHFLPELPALRLEHDPIHRHKDVLSHTIAVIENVQPDLGDFAFRLTRLAALFHDVGKPRTRGYLPGKGTTFHHHDVVGARMARKRMEALRYPAADIAAVSELVFLHLRFHTYKMGWSDSAVRRYVRDAGDLLAELNVLTRCDCTTRNERKAARLAKRMDELEARVITSLPSSSGRSWARRWPFSWRSASRRVRSATMKRWPDSTRGGRRGSPDCVPAAARSRSGGASCVTTSPMA
jgi:poly(A) polymerase